MLLAGLLVVASIAAGLVMLAFVLQRSVLFPARAAGPVSPGDLVPGTEVVDLDGVEAWFLPPPRDRRPAAALVFTHGNGELIDDWLLDMTVPVDWGLGVMLVEYPGYGRSAGRPSEASITRTMLAAWDHLAARPEVDPERIVAYGRSLGGGAACALAGRRPVAAMVLESSFASVRSMARGFGLPGPLVRDPFDNLSVVRGFDRPVLILHGVRDGVIPVRHAHRLHDAAPASELELLDCGHNDCPRPWPRIRRFLAENGLLERGA